MTVSGRADALVAADETLELLGIDQRYVIDPFAAIDRLGLALHITNLDNLLGAVVPDGNGGVLITSQRSSAIQRYTAAHEIGHWVLHADHLRMDGEAEVLGHPSSELEREAQLFAGYFLMPPTLLNHAVAAYGLRRGQIKPEHVYRLSRDLGVSYEATARRLLAARFINQAAFQRILDLGRMSALRRASGNHRPENGLADMWDATSNDELVSLVVEEHDEVMVDLVEQRLAGWRWQTEDELAQRNGGSWRPRSRPIAPPEVPVIDGSLRRRDQFSATDYTLAALGQIRTLDSAPDDSDADEDAAPATVVEDSFTAGDEPQTKIQRQRRRRIRARQGGPAMEIADGPPIGGNGVRTVIVRTVRPGGWQLQLFYAHAYDPRDEPLFTYELQLAVQPTPNTAFRRRQLESDLDRRLPGDPDDDAEFEVDVA
ncbi:MAG: ImmA/IrrE family metallo-endopeptidase [Jatrophihabitans sp.]